MLGVVIRSLILPGMNAYIAFGFLALFAFRFSVRALSFYKTHPVESKRLFLASFGVGTAFLFHIFALKAKYWTGAVGKAIWFVIFAQAFMIRLLHMDIESWEGPWEEGSRLRDYIYILYLWDIYAILRYCFTEILFSQGIVPQLVGLVNTNQIEKIKYAAPDYFLYLVLFATGILLRKTAIDQKHSINENDVVTKEDLAMLSHTALCINISLAFRFPLRFSDVVEIITGLNDGILLFWLNFRAYYRFLIIASCVMLFVSQYSIHRLDNTYNRSYPIVNKLRTCLFFLNLINFMDIVCWFIE